MPKSPFDRLGDGAAGSSKVVLGQTQISAPSKTQESTAGIGKLSIDLSGPKRQTGTYYYDTNMLGEQVGGAVGGAVEAVGGLPVIGPALGALGEGLNFLGQELLYKPQAKQKIERYIQRKDYPSLPKQKDILQQFGDWFTVASNPFNPKRLTNQLAFEKSLEGRDPVTQALAKGAYGVAEVAAMGAGVVAAGRLGGPTQLGFLGSAGKVIGGTAGGSSVATLLSTDPDELPNAVKSMLDNGATPDEAIDFMSRNYNWFGDDLATNLITQIYVDPLNKGGSLFRASQRIAGIQDVSQLTGKSFSEIAASQGMNKMEIAVAKRFGLLGSAYRAGGRPIDKLKEIVRGDTVVAIKDVLRMGTFVEAENIAKRVGGSAPELLRTGVNRSMQYVITDALKAPLSRTAVENSRGYADLVMTTAGRDGIEGLRNLEGLRGANDAYLQKFVDLTQAYKKGRKQEQLDAIEEMTQLISENKNIEFLNKELSGPILRQAATRLPVLGRLQRSETIGAGRLGLLRSMQRFEAPIARYMTDPSAPSSVVFRSKITKNLQTLFDTSGNGNAEVVVQEVNRLFEKSLNMWKAGKKADAVADLARILEVFRLGRFAKAIELADAARKLTGLKITPVLESRFSLDGLKKAIDDLQSALDSGDSQRIIDTATDIVIGNDDLAFKFDNVDFEAQLADDPVREATDVLRALRRIERTGAWVSRIPDDLAAKLDFIETGGMEDVRLGMEENPLVGGTKRTLESIYNTSQLGATQANKINSASDIVKFFDNETTEPIASILHHGEDKMHNYVNFGGDKWSNGDSVLDHIYLQVTKQNVDPKIDQIFGNPFLERQSVEAFHQGVLTLNRSTWSNVYDRSEAFAKGPIYGNFGNFVKGLSKENVAAADVVKTLGEGESVGGVKLSQTSFIPLGWNERLVENTSFLGSLGAGNKAKFQYANNRLMGFRVNPETNIPLEFNMPMSDVGTKDFAAVAQLAWNRVFRTSAHSGKSGDGIWQVPPVRVSKANLDGALSDGFGSPSMTSMNDLPFGYYSQDLYGITDPVNMGQIGPRSAIIPGDSQEGFETILSLTADARAKLYLSPQRLAAAYAMEGNPRLAVPDLDRISLVVDDQSKDLLRAVELTQSDMKMSDYIFEQSHNADVSVEDYLKVYLSKPISNVVSGEGSYTVFDMVSEYLVGKKTTIQAEGWENIGKALQDKGLIDDTFLALDMIDGARKFGTDMIKGAQDAYSITSTIDELGDYRMSWADFLHGMDATDAITKGAGSRISNLNYGSPSNIFQRAFNVISSSDGLDPVTFALLRKIDDTDKELVAEIRSYIMGGDYKEALDKISDYAFKKGTVIDNKNLYYELMTSQVQMHALAESIGTFMDTRIARRILKNLSLSPNQDHWRRQQTFQRVFDPSGFPLLERRFVSPLEGNVIAKSFKPTNAKLVAGEGKFVPLIEGMDTARITAIIDMMRGNVDGAQSALAAEKAAKMSLPKPGSEAAEKLVNDEQMQQLVQTRASMRELGYEMGIEPKSGYIQGYDVVKGVDGKAVVRPRYDLYTSIDENVDLSGFGLGDPATTPLVQGGLLQKARSSFIPIANNELYDLAVERFRVYLGNKVSREESLRIMANLVERAVQQEINPGGLTEVEVADIALSTFGNGEKAAQKYARVFGPESGNASPRAALLYALQGDAKSIGLTTNFSKRIQAQRPELATLANKLYPLMRYRYNPYFNQQEAIEPYAFTLLRGIRGEKDFREGSMLSEVLAAPGAFRYDNHEIGAHVLRVGGSVMNEISQSIPKSDELVEQSISKVVKNAGGKVYSYLVPVSAEMRQVIARRKLSAIDATALNEVRRSVGPRLAKEFPEFNKVMYDITGTMDVSTNLDALIDMHIYGTIPAKIQSIADVSSAPYTFGVKSNIADVVKLRDDISVRYLTEERLAEMDNIAVQLAERIPDTFAAKKRILSAFHAYKKSISAQASGAIRETAEGPYAGKAAVTTLDNVKDESTRALREWVSNKFQNISRYLVAKNEFKAQPILGESQNVEDMVRYATNAGEYRPNASNPFNQMDKFIKSIDDVVTTNRVAISVPLYRGINFERLVAPGTKIEVGTEFGYESFSSFSRSWATAKSFADEGAAAIIQIPNPKGLLGFDLNAVGASHIRDEAEVLLPRGTRFRIVQQLQDIGGKEQYVVDVILAPDYISSYRRLSPTEAARSSLVSAFNDFIIEDAKIEKSSKLVERLLATSPAVLNEVQRMGVNFGEDLNVVRNIRTTRQKLSVNPANMGATETGAMIDSHRGVPEFQEAPVAPISAPEIVFGEATGKGPEATLNVGGRTNTWRGTDGVTRYVKRVAKMDYDDQRFAAINEYINNQLYRRMGVSVPQSSLVVDPETAEIYHASEWIGGIKTLREAYGTYDKVPQEVAKQIMDNHVADLIVGNTDVVGLQLDNVGILDNGRVVRIDVGSTAKFKAGGVHRGLSEGTPDLVRPEYVFNPNVGGSGKQLRDIAIRAYPDLKSVGSMTEIPTFLSQYSEMRAMLGDTDQLISDTLKGVEAEVLKAKLFTPNELAREFGGELPRIIKSRLASLDVIATKLREEAAALADLQKSAKPIKIKGKKFKASTMNISRRLAEAAARDELRLPALDEALKKMENKQLLTPEEEMALGKGLSNFLFQRAAMQDMIGFFKTAHIKGMEIAAREQLYNPYKGALERTLNHPFLGPYPTSYMYGKILPAFINALFKYAPFTSEYAPFVGYRRFDLIADHVAAALETSPELQEYVNSRPPLIMFLNGLLPGWPTDIGVSLPYWMREGIMRPVAEGKLESIPGELTRGVTTQIERTIGPLQTIRATTSALSDIQNFLTGDPQRSVIDEVSDFLTPRE